MYDILLDLKKLDLSGREDDLNTQCTKSNMFNIRKEEIIMCCVACWATVGMLFNFYKLVFSSLKLG